VSDPPEPLKTALHGRHRQAGAVFAEEAGFVMPLGYGSTLSEYRQARTSAAVIDVSNLGRISIRGDGSLDLLEKVLTHDVARQADDTAHYTLLCNRAGGIIDHGLCVRLEDGWLLSTSPLGRVRVLEHLREHAASLEVRIDDQTESTAHLYLTGPQAPARLEAVLGEKVSAWPAGTARAGTLMIARYVAIRSAEAGQWAMEVILPNAFAGQAWDYVTSGAGGHRFAPAGLAVWDIMRVEAGTVRFGHEINETIDPITAGLEHWVRAQGQFVGAEALRKLGAKEPARRRVGLVLPPPADDQPPPIPRQGNAVFDADRTEVGVVTSGAFSPHLEQAIAMAYVSSDAADPGTELAVVAESQPVPAKVVPLPFFKP
jgi:aminomethyltransferase